MAQVRRRQVLIAAGAMVAAAYVRGQKPRVPRLGLLWLGSPETTRLRGALLEGLRGQGYLEGSSILIDDRSSVSRYDQLDAAAADLVRQRPDVIVTFGNTATKAARKATSTIPIVMITSSDPILRGFVASLGRPGGNITGITMIGELVGKRLALLKEAVPRIRRVAIMLNPASDSEVEASKTAQVAARTLDLAWYVAEVHLPEDFEATFSRMMRAQVDSLLVNGGTMFFEYRERIAQLALTHRLPAITNHREYADAGALLAYGGDIASVFKQAAGYVAKILKGASPAELPFEQSKKLDFVVNLKTAQTLGLSIPHAVQLQATELIQ